MNSTRRILAPISKLLLLCVLCAQSLGDSLPQIFTTTTLAAIQQQHHKEPFLLVLWSVHCAPCFAELAMLGKELRAKPDLPLVLVSTDTHASPADMQIILEDYGLQNVQAWQFSAEFPEQLRYGIDPGWYGELPRSYFYAAAHSRQSHSGQLSREMLLSWFGLELEL